MGSCGSNNNEPYTQIDTDAKDEDNDEKNRVQDVELLNHAWGDGDSSSKDEVEELGFETNPISNTPKNDLKKKQ